MPTIKVLKSFVFSTPVPHGVNGPAIEKRYTPGVHEINDEMWNHPWVSKSLADGCIESPQQTLARAQLEKEAAKKAEDNAIQATAQAEAAFARLKSNGPGATASKEEIEKELNTPVNQLRKKGAMGQPGAIK